ILAQKPLARNVREARACVAACERAGVALAVNQNMRYDPAVRALKHLLGSGALGAPVLATIDMRAIPHWMPWAKGLPSLATFVMSIHHLDTFRYWLGTPERVLASTRPDPRTAFPHEDGINLYVLEYADGCRAAAWDDVWTGPARDGGGGVPLKSFRPTECETILMSEAQTPAEYLQIAQDRLEDARELLSARRNAGAYYLSGYGVECSLKSLLLERSTPAQRPKVLK